MSQTRRNSYTVEFKLKVVMEALENGTRSAANIYGICERMIRRWKIERHVLEASKKTRRSFRYRRPIWPGLEQLVKEWVLKQRSENRKVSTVSIRLQAKRIARENGLNDFKGGSNWCYNFMRRASLSVRATTSVGQHLPEDYEEKIARFRHFVCREIGAEIRQKDIGNMDEVPVSFDLPGNYTVDRRGKQDIAITTTGHEKCNFTVVLCVTADGQKCPPMVIFKRKTIPKERFPPGIVIKVNQNGWMTEKVMQEWLEECWLRRPNPSMEQNKSLLILDSARSHLTNDVKAAIQERSKLAVIPAGLTKLLQPLDISVNKSFNNHLRNKWEQWMLETHRHTFTRGGRMRRATYSEVSNWVLESFSSVSATCIQNGFRRELNKEQQQEGEELEEEDDLEVEENEIVDELPEELMHALESFNIISDD